MAFFATIGVIAFIYYLVSVILWLVCDSDIELFYKEKFGKKISSLKGKVVWITGASSGIGKQLALLMAKNGVKLCLSARNVDRLDAVKMECLKLGKRLQPNDVLVLQMDMLDLDSHQKKFDKVMKHFGQIDVLVNNAGRSQRALFRDIHTVVDRDVFELDVFSVVNLSRIYVRKFNGRGHIAITSSSVGMISVPNSASYTAAKHAIHGYFETLKLEEPDMKVTIFCPGPTSTEFLEQAFTDEPGRKYNESVQATDRRMSAERCAQLMATAIANDCETNFVGPFPVVALMYISCYYPNLRKLILMILGRKGLQRIRDSNDKI